jgi:transcriptional regulator with XRE-family HTH domain
MALATSEVRRIVEQACARQDVLDACARRDLGTLVGALGAHGLTQGQIADLTGILQGRLSEYMTGKRSAKASATFEKFADGLGLPPAARQALGLDPGPAAGTGIPQPRQPLPGETGLAYPDTPAQATQNAGLLWRADLSAESTLSCARIEPGAWNDVSLRWLVDPVSQPDPGLERRSCSCQAAGS